MYPDFTIDLAHSSRATVGRDFTTTPILLINCFNNGFGETKDEESCLYSRLRLQAHILFDEMLALGQLEDLSTLSFSGGMWRWDDWSCSHSGSSFSPIRMERGRGTSVIRARKTYDSGIVGNKAWEVPTPVGLEIDPNFLELWTELLDKYSLQPRLYTQES